MNTHQSVGVSLECCLFIIDCLCGNKFATVGVNNNDNDNNNDNNNDTNNDDNNTDNNINNNN